MLATDLRIIPKSRIAPAAGTSRQYVDKIIAELKAAGVIAPQRTASGREMLTFAEMQIVWTRLRKT